MHTNCFFLFVFSDPSLWRRQIVFKNTFFIIITDFPRATIIMWILNIDLFKKNMQPKDSEATTLHAGCLQCCCVTSVFRSLALSHKGLKAGWFPPATSAGLWVIAGGCKEMCGAGSKTSFQSLWARDAGSEFARKFLIRLQTLANCSW